MYHFQSLGFSVDGYKEDMDKYRKDIDEEKELEKREKVRAIDEKKLTNRVIRNRRFSIFFRYFLYLWSIGAVTGSAYELFKMYSG